MCVYILVYVDIKSYILCVYIRHVFVCVNILKVRGICYSIGLYVTQLFVLLSWNRPRQGGSGSIIRSLCSFLICVWLTWTTSRGRRRLCYRWLLSSTRGATDGWSRFQPQKMPSAPDPGCAGATPPQKRGQRRQSWAGHCLCFPGKRSTEQAGAGSSRFQTSHTPFLSGKFAFRDWQRWGGSSVFQQTWIKNEVVLLGELTVPAAITEAADSSGFTTKSIIFPRCQKSFSGMGINKVLFEWKC